METESSKGDIMNIVSLPQIEIADQTVSFISLLLLSFIVIIEKSLRTYGNDFPIFIFKLRYGPKGYS